MRTIILTLVGAALITSATTSIAVSEEHHRGVGNANAFMLPALPPPAASERLGDVTSDSMRCAMSGMYADNDLNVYRNGRCGADVDAHGG